MNFDHLIYKPFFIFTAFIIKIFRWGVIAEDSLSIALKHCEHYDLIDVNVFHDTGGKFIPENEKLVNHVKVSTFHARTVFHHRQKYNQF